MPTNQNRAGAVAIPAVAAATLFLRPYAKSRTSWSRGRDTGESDLPPPAGERSAAPTEPPAPNAATRREF